MQTYRLDWYSGKVKRHVIFAMAVFKLATREVCDAVSRVQLELEHAVLRDRNAVLASRIFDLYDQFLKQKFWLTEVN